MIGLFASAMAASLVQGGAPAVQGPHYRVELAVSDGPVPSLRGQAYIVFKNPSDKPLAALPMVLHPNESSSGRVSVERLEVVKGPKGTFATGPASELLLTFDVPLAPGETVEVATAFHGPIAVLAPDTNDLFAQGLAQLQGLQRGTGGGDYGLLASGDGLLVAASPFPMVVPFVSGGFAHRVLRQDNPIGDLAWNVPASFEVTVVTPAGMRVVTNLVDQVVPGAEGSLVTKATGSHVAEFVLVASRDFVTAERKVGALTVRSHSLSRDKAAGAAVLDTAVKSLVYLQRYGAYPFTELDLVEASLTGGAGGVEFGAMALIAGFLYRDPGQNPLTQLLPMMGGAGMPSLDMAKQRDFVVAHEVAHQWSPGLVGADAWQHAIIDEPLAQYLALRVVTDGLSSTVVEEAAAKNLYTNYGLFRLMGGKDAPANRETSAFVSNLEYGALVYGKAPGLYRALEAKLGARVLDKALASAMKQHAWTTVTPDAWLASLQASGATDAVALGTRWWSEGHGDEDLGVDAGGNKVMEWMLGKAMAAELAKTLAPMGLSPAALFRTLLGGGLPGPGAVPTEPPPAIPGVDTLLEQLLKAQ